MTRREGECESCLIVCGPGQLEIGTTHYRNHDICGFCLMAWRRIDAKAQELFQRDATWEELINPVKSWFRSQKDRLEKVMRDELAPAGVGGRHNIRH